MSDYHDDMNRIDPDDPRLTAYALGELEGEEAQQFAARVEVDAELRDQVQAIRAGAERLNAALSAEERLFQALLPSAVVTSAIAGRAVSPRRFVWFSKPVLLAAGLAIAATAAITTVSLLNGPDTPGIVQRDAVEVKGFANIRKALATTTVAVDFDDATLSEVFAFLHKQTGVRIDTDWAALKKRGVTAETRVTITDEKLHPASDVLAHTLRLAWEQSPHPDAAQWSVTDAGVTVAPKSALVQARLDATAKLLDDRQYSRAKIEAELLNTGVADVWDTDVWNKVLAKRAEAGERVLAEVDASLALAEEEAAKQGYDAAESHGVYAYQLLAGYGMVLQGDQFDAPLERISKLQETIFEGRLAQDRFAIVEAVTQAKANDTELNEYDAALAVAVEALDNQSFDAAAKAITDAATHLNGSRDAYEPAELGRLAARANRLHSEILFAQREASRDAADAAQAAYEAAVAAKLPATEIESLKEQVVQAHLRSVKVLLDQHLYDDSLVELGEALVIAPELPALTDFYSKVRLESQADANGKTRAYFGRTIETNRPVLLRMIEQKMIPSRRHAVALGAELDDMSFRSRLPVLSKLPASYAFFRSDFGVDGLHTVANGRGKTRSLGLLPNADGASRGHWGFYGADGYATAEGLAPWGKTEVQFGNQRTDHLGLVSWDDVTAAGAMLVPSGEAHLNWRIQQPITELSLLPSQEPFGVQLKRRIAQLGAQAPAEQINQIKLARERVAAVEPFERQRIESFNELQDLERLFQEGTLQALQADQMMSRDAYAMVNDNPFKNPAEPGQAISTFSVDVDTAAYSLVRRQLMQQKQLPVPGAIRIEEMINYFDYGYDAPVVDSRALEEGVVTQASLEQFEKDNEDFAPFVTHVQVTDCPWTAENQLVRIGIQGMDVQHEDRPTAHLTFLLDVSGSMNSADKLPLVKDSIKLLLDKLNDRDRISIVVYAGQTRTVIENVSAKDRPSIEKALDELNSGGSTAGAAGIQLAYDAAQKHFIDGGVNRVILCTDGDFNVGISNTDELVSLIKQKANPARDEDGKQRGVYLSVLGYGMGNLNDAMMEPLTNAGNGTYAYIDSHDEAQKVMYDQAGSTLVAIAKDVKVQVHFDPDQVEAYRLIGYENRILATKDFDDDTVDAGDIGAGHSVTALYEIVPAAQGPALNDEGFREVKLRAEELEHAITLNHSLMQTCSLNEGQSMRLIASSKLLEQELVFCRAAIETHDAAVEIDDEPMLGEAPAVADEAAAPAEVDDRPEVELDDFADGAMMSLRLRYKPVDAPAEQGSSRRIDERVFAEDAMPFSQADESTRFAAAVAGFGMVLRSSPHAGETDLSWVLDTATVSATHDPDQRRSEFIDLIGEAMKLMANDPLGDAFNVIE